MPRKKIIKPPVDKESEENGKTLIELCRTKELEEVKAFLESKKANVNYILPRYHTTALHAVLIRPNQERMLELLIKHKADVNLSTKKHGKALDYLLTHGFRDCGASSLVEYTRILLQSGADLHSVDLEGRSAFHLSLISRREAPAEVIYDHCLSISNAEQKKYYYLCRYILNKESIDFDHLKNFLKKIKDVNFPTISGAESPLFFAVRRGDLELVKILLEKGSDPNNSSYALNPHWILHFVLYYHHHLEMLKLLLKHKMKLNFQLKIDTDMKNETPLTWILKTKRLRLPKIETLKLMLDSGAEVNGRNSRRQTALHVACDPDHFQTFDMEVIKVLLDYNVDVNATDLFRNTALHKALYFKENNKEVIELLLQKGANPHLLNRENQTILHVACTSLVCTPVEIIKLILDLDVYTWVRDTSERLALHDACYRDNVNGEIIKLLIQKMIDQGVENDLPFVENNKLKLQKLQDKYRFTPLNAACCYSKLFSTSGNRLEPVKILLQHDVDVNHRCDYNTPLLAGLENFEITELLLKNGADPNLKYFRVGRGPGWRKYETPLQQACQYTGAKTVKLLIDYGADITVLDKGKNLLHLALENNKGESLEVLKTLLKTRDLSVENVDESGKSVLDKCSEYCSKLALIWSYGNIKINFNAMRRCYGHKVPKPTCSSGTKCQIYNYLAKMALLGINCTQAFPSEVALYGQIYEENNFAEELEKMKRILVNDYAEVTLFDILFMKPHQLLGSIMQKSLKKLFEDEEKDFEKSYPHYGFMLNSVVGRALDRGSYISSAHQVFSQVFGNRTPATISNIILNYHNNKFLKRFVNESNPIFNDAS